MKEIINLYSPQNIERYVEEYSFEQQRKMAESFFRRINVDILVDIFADLKRRALGWERGDNSEDAFKANMKCTLLDHDIEEGVRGGVAAGTQPMIADEVVFARLKIFTRGLGIDGENSFPKFLKIVIHELAHVASLENRLQGEHLIVGFQSASIETKQFTPLNEAFTEYVADAVYGEYMRRTGNKDDATTISYGPIDIKYDRELYGVYRQWLAILIEDLANEAEVEIEEIVRSMLGHYMRADFFQEIDALYREISPQLREEIEMQKIDPFGFGNQITHAADLEDRFVAKLKLICRELLQKKEGRKHVEAIFGTDIFVGKRFVAR